jgi:hypothetical protein
VYGFLGRHYTPDLYLTGRTDAVVLVLPGRVVGGLAGELLSGLVAAGAFAAFMSTSSGLLISVAGALTHDVLRGGVRQFDINMLVGWAFAIAASSFCPLLVLGDLVAEPDRSGRPDRHPHRRHTGLAGDPGDHGRGGGRWLAGGVAPPARAVDRWSHRSAVRRHGLEPLRYHPYARARPSGRRSRRVPPTRP